MHLKDHYTVLELAPSASVDDIKKAYRRLAHQYHPDKKGNDPYAAAHFAAVKEAYETLTNPVKKDHYLQQRWYAKSQGKINPEEVITPVVILKKLLELDKYVSRLDIHRLDFESLVIHISTLLSGETIYIINSFNEPLVNKEIVLTALKISRYIPYRLSYKLEELLSKINTGHATDEKIAQQFRQSKNADFWENKRIWIILILTVLVTALIFLMAR